MACRELKILRNRKDKPWVWVVIWLNFDNATISGINYGGHSGSKKEIILNGERLVLKYPKLMKSMNARL